MVAAETAMGIDSSQITLTQMRYAVAVDETRNFLAAARKCYVSQSGLSMQLAKLEELLGVLLFDRSRKPLLPTPEGEVLLEQMRVILRETSRLGQLSRDEQEPAGSFRLGVIPTVSASVLPLVLRDFMEKFPKVELIIQELQTSEILSRLHVDSIDAGLLATPLDLPGVDEVALARESFFAYLPPQDPFLEGLSLGQEELSQRKLWLMSEGHCFRTQVLSWCGRASRGVELISPGPLGVRFESGSFETLVRLVDSGLGATVLPELFVRGLSPERRERVRALVRPVPMRELGLVSSRSQLRARVKDALAQELGAALTQILGNSGEASPVLRPLASS